jgi:hypothetical protein
MLRNYAIAALVALGPLTLGAPAPHDPTYAANGVPSGSELFSVRAAQLQLQARDAFDALAHPATLVQSSTAAISQAADRFGVDPIFSHPDTP